MPLGTTYINEFAPRRVTNVFTLWGVGLGWSMGGTVAGLVGFSLPPISVGKVCITSVRCPFILALALQIWLPESAKFLALHHRILEILRVLSLLRPDRIEVYREAHLEFPAAETRTSVGLLLSDRYRRTTVTLWASSFLSLFCIFGLTGWVPYSDDAAGRNLRDEFWFWRSDANHVICRWHCLRRSFRIRRGSSRGMLAVWWVLGGISVWSLILLNTHASNLLPDRRGRIFHDRRAVCAEQFHRCFLSNQYSSHGLGHAA